MRGIQKSFGSVTVLRDVNLDCRAGEVLALCGENGAGKSTLMKVLSGIHAPDAGEIRIDGERMQFTHPAAARDAGVAIIHQELALLAHRTVAENICLGREPSRRGVLDRKAMREIALAALGRVGSTIDPDIECSYLGVAEQQMVEIARAVSLNARILVLDEPTAALDDVEAAKLFDLIAQFRVAGVAILYISHRMAEVMRLADNIAVIKDGQLMATLPAAAASVEEIVRLMVGRTLSDFYPPGAAREPGEVVMAIERGGNEAIDRIDLEVCAGEIVGVAGLESSGKSALARALFGLQPLTRGRYRDWTGEPAPASAREAARRGIGYLPDDRKREGLGLRQSLRDNAALSLRSLAEPFAAALGRQRSNGVIDAWLQKVEVRAAAYTVPVGSLSGGNQQKVIVARWLACRPRMWVVCEPTRGVDVGAKAAIYQILRDYADAGGGGAGRFLGPGGAHRAFRSHVRHGAGPHRRRTSARCIRGGHHDQGGQARCSTVQDGESSMRSSIALSSSISNTNRSNAKKLIHRYGVALALFVGSALLYVTAAIVTGQWAQLSFQAIVGLLQRMVALGLVALGQSFVILVRSIDLSVANLVSVSAVLGAWFMHGDQAAIVQSVAAVLLIAAAIGAINGLLVACVGVSPLIATLGVGLILQGLLTLAFTSLSGAVPKAFRIAAYGKLCGLPLALLFLAVAAAAAAFVLNRTRVGAHLYAVGGNAQSARFAGIRTARAVVGAHAVSGLMSGLAGLYLMSWLGAGTPWVGRDGGYELDSIAVVVIGGTLLSGGRGGGCPGQWPACSRLRASTRSSTCFRLTRSSARFCAE